MVEMKNVDTQYIDLLKDILANGIKKSDRTGTGTLSVFGRQMRFNMQDGFPLITTKKIFTKAVIHELLWFLKGGDNIKYLVDNGVNIWNEWPYKRYEQEWMKENPPFSAPYTDRLLNDKEFIDKIKTDDEFAEKWGGLGPVYGKQWVGWKKYNYSKVNEPWMPCNAAGQVECEVVIVDQIKNLINDLKNNPDSRRHLVTAWNPGELDDQILPPCHYAFQCWTRELTAKERDSWYNKNGAYGTGAVKMVAFIEHESNDVQEDKEVNKYIHSFLDEEGVPRRALSLMFHMRSVDCALGMPFDIASYGILLSMLAQVTGMVSDELVITSGDTHIYLNHVDALKEQLEKEPYQLPELWLNPDIDDISKFTFDDVKFVDYKSHPSIKMDVAI